jgi:7-cyano-7-deazaguanine synthase
MWLDKEETWAKADSLGGFETVRDMTLTCYNGIKGEGCGNCPACKLRKRGFDRYMQTK